MSAVGTQGVPSVNGITGPVNLVGAGGTVINTDGETITITSAGGGGGTGVQGIQNTDNALNITDPTGPTATINVKPLGITTTHLAANSVTSDKILDGTITTLDVANNTLLNADIAANAAIAESKLALNFPTHSNANDPNAAEKAALAGTTGTPGNANRYVTNTDPRLADARTPAGPAGGDLAGTFPNPTGETAMRTMVTMLLAGGSLLIALFLAGCSKDSPAGPGADAAELVRRGWERFRAGDLIAAATLFESAAGADPALAEAPLGLAWTRLRQRQLAAAETSPDRAAALGEDDAPFHAARAIAARERTPAAWTVALAAADRVLTLVPTWQFAQDASMDWRDVRLIAGQSAFALGDLRTIGGFQINLGLYDEARPNLERALETYRREAMER